MHRFLRLSQVNATLWIELINPPVNFLTTPVLEEISDVVRSAEGNPAVKVIVFTGGLEDTYVRHLYVGENAKVIDDMKRDPMFKLFKSRFMARMVSYLMTGLSWMMDWFPGFERRMLKSAKAMSAKSGGLYLSLILHRTFLAIERSSKVTIAAINGTVNGGGAEMAACFDFRFMVNDMDFTIGQFEVLVGTIPGAGGTQRWPRLIGKAKALEMMLTGDLLSAEEAKSIGMITNCFPKKDFLLKVHDFAQTMSRRPTVAVNAIKRSVHEGYDLGLRHAISIESEGSVSCLTDPVSESLIKGYVEYIDTKILSASGKPPTIRETLEHLKSDDFLVASGALTVQSLPPEKDAA